jgi:hypothetical protein
MKRYISRRAQVARIFIPEKAIGIPLEGIDLQGDENQREPYLLKNLERRWNSRTVAYCQKSPHLHNVCRYHAVLVPRDRRQRLDLANNSIVVAIKRMKARPAPCRKC